MRLPGSVDRDVMRPGQCLFPIVVHEVTLRQRLTTALAERGIFCHKRFCPDESAVYTAYPQGL